MIIRVARAKVCAGKSGEFRDRVEQVWVSWLESQKGMLGCYPGIDPHVDEFVMVSLWADIDSLKRIGDKYWNRAMVQADELDLLEAVDVHHYEAFGRTSMNPEQR